MGAKTGLLVYADADVPELLHRVESEAPDLERTLALMRRLYPEWEIAEGDVSNLSDAVYPPDGTAYAASWPGVEVVCDRRVMVDEPSQLAEPLVGASRGRRLVLHAMHSVVDWLAFAVWEDGRLVRSLSVSPDSGIIENVGDPLPFELPYWAGERPAEVIPWPGEEDDPYPLPFHPLDFGEDALRALCGFIIEGRPEPGDVDADSIALHGFAVHDPSGPSRSEKEEALKQAVAAMGPGRFYSMGPDGRLVERSRPKPMCGRCHVCDEMCWCGHPACGVWTIWCGRCDRRWAARGRDAWSSPSLSRSLHGWSPVRTGTPSNGWLPRRALSRPSRWVRSAGCRTPAKRP
ncbi:DUF6928 family protein [Actinacidiphila acidipaludis]|uniref:DUF6928 family protein n=1 Tax=Actinacidiphila acidipaludis TaxID=2873382 RepID=UPI00223ABD40|nr:hypothetical protein [Streptomyces acidipaludis]